MNKETEGVAMKISSELERMLQVEQSKSNKTGKTDASVLFGDVLNEELENTHASSTDASKVSVGTTSQVSLNLILDAKTITKEDMGITNTILTGIDGTLADMDEYSNALQNPSTQNLKQAWNDLSSMNADISTMRKDYSKLSRENTDLDTMINDLEIMAVTETFKFNRGDYL